MITMNNEYQYNWELLPQLCDKLATAQSDAVHADLDVLIRFIHVQSNNDLTLFKLRAAQIMSTCMRSARQHGAQSDGLLEDHVAALARLSQYNSTAGIKRSLHKYIDSLLKQIQQSDDTPISKIIEDIKNRIYLHPGQDHSLVNYARSYEISTGHLSRCFHQHVGQSFSDTISLARFKHAKDLLLNSNDSIKHISQLLGIANPSQFIADFKRHCGMTPGAYRKHA